MPPLPVHAHARPGSARFGIKGYSFKVEFDNRTVGGLHLVDTNDDSFPDKVDWARAWLGVRDCSEFFEASTAAKLSNPNTTCEWYSNNSMEVRLATADAVNLGDKITFRKYVIYGYNDDLKSWTFSPAGAYELLHPQPLLAPAMDLFSSSGADLGQVSKVDVPICKDVRVDALPTNNYHGALPEYTWLLHTASCTYTDGGGDIDNYQPSSAAREKLEKRLKRASVGSGVGARGSEFLNVSTYDLESGCTYRMSLKLQSRWGLSTTKHFALFKEGPNNVGWSPTCRYHCNAATCEPPSTCVNGQCVCFTGRWGPTCRGACLCSPYNTDGCDPSTGNCICKRGKYGSGCNQNVEWKKFGWSPCLPCGSPKSSQFLIWRCVISEFQASTIVDDKHCIAEAKGEVQECTPALCPCKGTVVPTLKGLDRAAVVSKCNSTSSGEACSAECLPGHLPTGEFRCYAGAFVEVPACTLFGGQVSTLLAVHVSFRIQGQPVFRMDAAEYLEEVAPALRALLVDGMRPYVLPSTDISFRIRKLEPSEVYNLAGGRRLANLHVEVSATIAVSSAKDDDAQFFISKLVSLPSSSKLVQKFNAEYTRTCSQSCFGGSIVYMAPSIPQRTQLYVDPSATPAPTTTSTTTLAPTPSPPAAVAAAASPESQTSISEIILLSAVITACIVWLCLLCGGGLWWCRKRRYQLAKVQPVKGDLFADGDTAWPADVRLTKKESAEKQKAEKAVAKIAKEQEKQSKKEAAEASKAEAAAEELAREQELQAAAEKKRVEAADAKLAREQEKVEAAERLKAEKLAGKLAKDQAKEAEKEAAAQLKAEQAATKLAKVQEKQALAEQLKNGKEAAKVFQEQEKQAAKDAAAQVKAEHDAAKLAAGKRSQEAPQPKSFLPDIEYKDQFGKTVQAFQPSPGAQPSSGSSAPTPSVPAPKPKQQSSFLPDIEYTDQNGNTVDWTSPF